MGDGFSALSDAQRAQFNAVLQKFGQDPAAVKQGPLDTADFGGNLVISSDSFESHVPPVLVPFTSMAHLKSMIGVPDTHYQSGDYADTQVPYPPPLPADRATFLKDAKNICDLRYHLTDDENETLLQAAHAYMQGNSAKVAAYEPLLDAHFTPGALAFVAAPSLTVQNGQTVTIAPSSTPVVLNFGVVTVIGTGQIVVNSAALTMVAQTFTAQPA
jgi:hypothetical protein